jgi:hypothetical protein
MILGELPPEALPIIVVVGPLFVLGIILFLRGGPRWSDDQSEPDESDTDESKPT